MTTMTLTEADIRPDFRMRDWPLEAITETGKALTRVPGLFFDDIAFLPGHAREASAVHARDAWTLDSVEPAQPDEPELSALPESVATTRTSAEAKLRSAIIHLVNRFFLEGYPSQTGRFDKISVETRNSAIALFSSLPPGFVSPKLSPDEEGLVIVWESAESATLAVLDGWTMHVVKSPGTDQAQYFDDLPYDRERIPPALLQAIPRK